jgi:hypothetical protein
LSILPTLLHHVRETDLESNHLGFIRKMEASRINFSGARGEITCGVVHA